MTSEFKRGPNKPRPIPNDFEVSCKSGAKIKDLAVKYVASTSTIWKWQLRLGLTRKFAGLTFEQAKEFEASRVKRYYNANKKRCLETRKLWYKNNADRILTEQKHKYATNEEYKETQLDRNRKLNYSKYGIVLEDYDLMLAGQGGVCKICGATPNGKRLHVDHCHSTGKVRGLLCNKCNFGIGLFNDDIQMIKKAVAYLGETQ